MSRSPYFFVERFNSERGYELQHPIIWNYNHTRQKEADLYPYNGDHDLFSIVQERGEYPYMNGIHTGMPKDTCREIKNQFTLVDGFDVPVRWFTYADMYIYYLKNPKVKNFNEEWYEDKEIPMTDNPIKKLMDRVNAFLEVSDDFSGWEDDYSQIRIVYWIY